MSEWVWKFWTIVVICFAAVVCVGIIGDSIKKPEPQPQFTDPIAQRIAAVKYNFLVTEGSRKVLTELIKDPCENSTGENRGP